MIEKFHFCHLSQTITIEQFDCDGSEEKVRSAYLLLYFFISRQMFQFTFTDNAHSGQQREQRKKTFRKLGINIGFN